MNILRFRVFKITYQINIRIVTGSPGAIVSFNQDQALRRRALIETITVLALIRTAPIAGVRRIP